MVRLVLVFSLFGILTNPISASTSNCLKSVASISFVTAKDTLPKERIANLNVTLDDNVIFPLKVNYVDLKTSEKPKGTIVFLSGLSRSWKFWLVGNYFKKYQQLGYRVLSMDAPNIGGTLRENGLIQTPDPRLYPNAVSALIKKLNVKGPIHLIGHSAGGGAALVLASQILPDQLASVIPVNMYGQWLLDWYHEVVQDKAENTGKVMASLNPFYYLRGYREWLDQVIRAASESWADGAVDLAQLNISHKEMARKFLTHRTEQEQTGLDLELEVEAVALILDEMQRSHYSVYSDAQNIPTESLIMLVTSGKDPLVPIEVREKLRNILNNRGKNYLDEKHFENEDHYLPHKNYLLLQKVIDEVLLKFENSKK